MRVLAIFPCDLYACLRAWGLGCACIVCACARCADVYSRLTSMHVCLRLYKRMCLQSKHMTRIVWLTLVHQSARRSSSYSVQKLTYVVACQMSRFACRLALSAYSVPTTRAKEPRQQGADKHATAQTLRLVYPLDPLGHGYPMLICSAGTR